MGRGRAPCCEKVGLNKGSWTPEEDMRLMAYIRKHGHANWRALPKQAGLLRCGKSCRLRWINYLRPDIKRGNFTKEEEDAVIKLHGLLGNKWSKIASYLPGRTDNEIKNVWNTHLKKRLSPKEQNPPPSKPEEPPSSPSTSASMTSSSQNEGKSDDQPMNPSSSSTDQHELVSEQNREASIEKIEIPIEPNLDIWDMLDDSILHPSQNSDTENISKLDLNLEHRVIASITDPLKDASKESSSSSSNSSTTTCNIGEEGVSQKPLEDMPDISIDPELWKLVDNCSFSFSFEEGTKVQHKKPSSLDEESNKEYESTRWLAYLEEELGLWGARDDIPQSLWRDAVEMMDCDPVSSYFQRGPSSPSPLDLLDFKCLDATS